MLLVFLTPTKGILSAISKSFSIAEFGVVNLPTKPFQLPVGEGSAAAEEMSCSIFEQLEWHPNDAELDLSDFGTPHSVLECFELDFLFLEANSMWVSD